MAMNCCVVPKAILGVAGVTAMDTRVALLTVNVVAPEMPPIAAVTVVAPALTGMANPLEPTALLTVATPVSEELQVANVVRFCVVLSE